MQTIQWATRSLIPTLFAAAFLLSPSAAFAATVHFTGAMCNAYADDDDHSRAGGRFEASDKYIYCSGWGITPSESANTVDASTVDEAHLRYNDGDSTGGDYVTAAFCLQSADNGSFSCSGTVDSCSPYGCNVVHTESGTWTISAPSGTFSSVFNMYIVVWLPDTDSWVASYSFYDDET